MLLYTSNPSRGVNTHCHSSLPCPLPVTVCWDLNALSAELHGVTLNTVISVLITLSSFTPTALTNTCTDKITFRQNCQRHCRVEFNKQVVLWVLSNRLSNDFASTFCCSTAVHTGLHNASVSLSRNIASLRTGSNLYAMKLKTSYNIKHYKKKKSVKINFRDMCPLC